ncbi:MAG: DUF3365 domain-containing protein [Armatimonadota bacterium]
MISRPMLAVCTLALLAGGSLAIAAPKKPARKPAPKPARKPAPKPAAKKPVPAPKMTEEEARVAAAMLDDAYQLFLQEIHDWYPNRTGQPVVAAKVVRDVQQEMNRKGWPTTRFLAVNAIVMNPDHQPQDAFEKEAIKVIKMGAEDLERREGDRLRIAKPVSLGGGCFACHWAPNGEKSLAAISFEFPVKAPNE